MTRKNLESYGFPASWIGSKQAEERQEKTERYDLVGHEGKPNQLLTIITVFSNRISSLKPGYGFVVIFLSLWNATGSLGATCKQFYCKTNHEKKVVKEGDGRSNSINGAIIGETLKLASTSPATKFPPLIVIFKDNTISFFFEHHTISFFVFFLHLWIDPNSLKASVHIDKAFSFVTSIH